MLMPTEMETLVTMILNSSISVVVIAYFMYRDYKFLNTLEKTLQSLVNTVDTLKDIIAHKTTTEFS